MTNVLEIENISKDFGGKTVVDRLSCQVRAGEVLGMLGHNGAGKTTTIRCVRLLSFLSGKIHPLLFCYDEHFTGKQIPILLAA